MCVPTWEYIEIAVPAYSCPSPCGVWVSQMSYSGSPSTVHAGIPMK